MIADLILWVLGSNPIQYGEEDKWPSIAGILSSYIVPYGQILLFLLPFAILKFQKKQFTRNRIIGSIVIGVVLAYAAYQFDVWLLDYGQASVFRAIYGE